MRQPFALTALLAVAACASGPPPPAALNAGSDTCRWCRMVVSDVHFAAQIVAEGEEPVFFDDLGCLRAYAGETATPSSASVVYVADHRTGAWVTAASAVYTRLTRDTTPMGGGMIAHGDEASRKADPAAAGGSDVPRSEAVGQVGGRR
jgi:copper chaperone NosL